MASRILLVIAVLPYICLTGVRSALLTKCKSEDAKCLKETTQAMIPVFAKGLPEYNVKTMDPINFAKIDASIPNLKLILTNVTLTGLRNCIAKKVKRDKLNNNLSIKLLCSLQLESQYEMDGQLLIIPIKGKGPLHVTLRKIELNVQSDLKEIEKDGATHWNLEEWKHTFSLKDRSDVVFENLFNGNEILALAARDVIASSGNEIILEVGPTTIKTIVDEVMRNINSFLHSVPANELSVD